MRSIFLNLISWGQETLRRPWRVFWICLIVLFVNLVLEGSLFRLWNLHRETLSLQQKKDELRTQSHSLSEKIKQASDPAFLEREARDRFDLVSEGDLVFVFSDDGSNE